MAIEEPTYKILLKKEDFEIREYEKVLVAETQVSGDFESAGNDGFKILAAYIFGANKSQTKLDMTSPVGQSKSQSSEKIAMTAPVSLLKNENSFAVQFTMPKGYTLENLPIPNNPLVHLKELPPRKMAVYSYSGSWSETNYQEKLSKFQLALKQHNILTKGEPIFARFNSPFQIWFLRRNEIWLQVIN